jgi:GT2 family glycosyltransferase
MSASASIVVPVHNRASLTGRCLDLVLAGLPAGCEVVVVDDASTDATPDVLAGYGEAIRTARMDSNVGFASACNEGARLAEGELLVFLNNDTEPQPGWLEALLRHAGEHPAAAVVGAKLLYPTGTVQHAGVAIGQDGYPHNLYAGFPGDHPAVNRSRRLQVVTAACMLVRRQAFEHVGGFDTGYLNSLEDVDLCLRIGEVGGEVHYCHEAVLTHLESASRGRQDRFERSVRLYRERWRGRARRDDLAVYAEDGLIDVEYAEAYPLRLAVSPQLAALGGDRDNELERLLEGYARQVSDLLGEVVRLTAALGEAPERTLGGAASPAAHGPLAAGFDHRAFTAQANRLEGEVGRLQRQLEQRAAPGDPEDPANGFAATPRLGYRHLVERVRAAVTATVPRGAAVLVVSRGDRNLVEFDGVDGRHFPQDEGGSYLGHHPLDSAEAVARLEALRAEGAQYLVVPSTAGWWLEHYAGFAEHLHDLYARTEAESCTIYCLERNSVEGFAEVSAG